VILTPLFNALGRRATPADETVAADYLA
jgi:hypothetical protein